MKKFKIKCKECGKKVSKNHITAKYCSNACKGRAYRKRHGKGVIYLDTDEVLLLHKMLKQEDKYLKYDIEQFSGTKKEKKQYKKIVNIRLETVEQLLEKVVRMIPDKAKKE